MGGARDAVLDNRCGSDCASGYGALRSAVQVEPGNGLDPADSDWGVCRIAGDVRDRAADGLKNKRTFYPSSLALSIPLSISANRRSRAGRIDVTCSL